MDEPVVQKTKKRNALIAVLLSLVMPGLGHIYCGRIVKGLVLCFFMVSLMPYFVFVGSVEQGGIDIVYLLLGIAVYVLSILLIIIGAFFTARRSSADYVLKDYNRWYVYLILFLISSSASGYAIQQIQSNYIGPFRMNAMSMYPTIVNDDKVLANIMAYKENDPNRGEMVVHINPADRNEIYCKRIIALAGDRIGIKGGQVFVNGERLERTSQGRRKIERVGGQGEVMTIEGEAFIESNGQAKYKVFISDIMNGRSFFDYNFKEITVPANHCFVLGDNRSNSLDSRYFGPVPLVAVKGRVEYLYWPVSDWSRFGKIE